MCHVATQLPGGVRGGGTIEALCDSQHLAYPREGDQPVPGKPAPFLPGAMSGPRPIEDAVGAARPRCSWHVCYTVATREGGGVSSLFMDGC